MTNTFNSFFQNYVFSFSTKIFLALTGFIFTFLIANFLTTSDYGLVMFYLAFASSLIGLEGLPTFKSIITVFSAKYKSETVFMKAIKWQYLLFIPMFLVCFFFASEIVGFLGKTNAEIFQLSTIVILLMPLHESYIALFQGFKSFGKVLKGILFENIANILLAYFFVIFLGLGMVGVIYAKLLSLLGFILIAKIISRKLKFEKTPLPKNEIIKFAKGIVPFNLFRRTNTQIKLIYLGLFVMNWELGFYYLLNKLIAYCVSAPKDSISTVLMPYSIERHKDKRVLANFVSLGIKFSFIITIVAGIIVLIIGYPFLALFFPSYSNAYYLIPFFVVHFIVQSGMALTSVFSGLNRTDILAKSSFVSLVIMVLFGFVLISNFGIIGLLLTEIVQVIVVVSIMLFYSRKINVPVTFMPTFNDFKYFYSKMPFRGSKNE